MPEQTIVADPAPAQELQAPSNPDSPEYANWRITGQIPDAPTPKSEVPAPSKSEKVAPVSETGDRQQEPRPSKAERRLTELLEDLKRAGLSPSELKTFKREAQRTAEAAKPTEQTVKPAEPLKRPKVEDFKTFEEYDAARDKYYESLTQQTVEKAIQTDRQRQAQEAGQREMRERLDKAKERYGDGADTRIIQTAKDIFSNENVNPAVKAVLNDSDVLVDVMYVMGSKAEELAEFLEEARTAPGKAIRRAVLLERLVKEELAKSVKSAPVRETSEESEEDEEPPPAKKVTKAPAPPREARGSAATPPDEVAGAVAANDARRYFAEQNRRDLQRRRTG